MHKDLVKKLIIATLVFLPGLAWASLEVGYPQIIPSMPTINPGSSTMDYIKYYYALFVIIGCVAAVVTIIVAGLNMIFSGGNTGKVSAAKNQVAGALIGIATLLTSYLILNAVNSDITEKGLGSTKCDNNWDVCVEYQRSGIKSYASSLSDDPSLGLETDDKIKIIQYKGLKEIWGFPEENFGGTPSRIESYEDNDVRQFNNPLPHVLEISSDIKSIKVYKKMPGLYLYDASNFGSSACAPLYIGASHSNLDSDKYSRSQALGNCEYKDRIKSIKILNPPGFRYYAILFAWNDYNKGYDYTFYPDTIPHPNTSGVIIEDAGSLPSSLKTNSVLLFKSSEGFLESVGDPGVTFYNALNCYVPGETNTEQVAGCGVPPIQPATYPDDWSPPFTEKDIALVCPSHIRMGQVLSVRVAKQYGVLMVSKGSTGANYYDSGYFFDISDPTVISGDCISDNIFFSKKDANGLNNIDKFIIVPFERRL